MINAIIESLVDDDDLTKPLLKTLVFAKRIGNEELTTWVSKELNGYDDFDTLPSYRYARTSVTGVMRQNGMLTKNVSLPLSCFGDQTAEILMNKRFPDSISTLESIVKNADGPYIGKDFPADFLQFLSQQAKKNGHNFQVISCRQLVMVSELSSINTTIRSKLLELLLQIEKDFPKVDDIKTDPRLKSDVNSTVNYYMGGIYNITSSGDGNLVNTGDKNTINAILTINKGDLNTLKEKLTNSGISQEDVDEIASIVASEQPSGNSFGQKTKSWISKMISKAVDESWKISIGVGAKLLEESIKNYYGLK